MKIIFHTNSAPLGGNNTKYKFMHKFKINKCTHKTVTYYQFKRKLRLEAFAAKTVHQMSIRDGVIYCME